MKRSALAFTAALLVLTAIAAAAETTPASTPTPPRPRIDIGIPRVADARGNQLALDLTWTYVEQENLARPTELDIIAILIGLHNERFTTTLKVPVPATGAIPRGAKVLITHNQPIVSPRDLAVTITVSPRIPGITDGSSNTVVAKREAVLHVEP